MTLALAGIWSIWFLRATLPVFVTTASAQIRASERPYQVVSKVSGRVATLQAELGDMVASSAVLVTLDTQDEHLHLEELRASEDSLRAQADGIAGELALRRKLLARSTAETAHAIDEAQFEADSARSESEQALSDFKRTEALAKQGLESDSEVQQARAKADQALSRRKAAEVGVQAAREAGLRDRQEVEAELAALQQQLATAQGELSELESRKATLLNEMDHYTLRAPVAGRLTDIRDVAVGSSVAAGDHVATILQSEELSAVGWFQPSQSLARIRAGQRAQLRLEGFPWTEYGSVPLIVSRVAGETRDGTIRIECSLDVGSAMPAVPLQHGLPGTLIIEVERASPFDILLRSVGKRLLPTEPSSS